MEICEPSQKRSKQEQKQKPVSWQECKAIAELCEKFMEPYENMPIASEGWQKARKEAPKQITVEDIIVRNASLFETPELNVEQRLPFAIDKRLALFFPILGQGTQRLVFDIGNDCVLKRCIPDGRMWEFDLNIMARRHAGMFAEIIEIGSFTADYCFEVQQKLNPLDPMKCESKIRSLYFPDSPMPIGNEKYPFFAFWEWGLDENGIPRVFDWG